MKNSARKSCRKKYSKEKENVHKRYMQFFVKIYKIAMEKDQNGMI